MSEGMKAVSVSQLNRYVKSRLDEDFRLRDLLLSGEISNLSSHYRSGHVYFVLKDQAAAVRAVLFRANAQRLPFALDNGMKVIVRCSVSLYERDGSFQIYVREVYPHGAGALYLAFEQLKAKLAAEGLFDEAHKRPVPPFPQVVGIVTSPTGAALQDMLNIIGRRWPACRVLFSPATVQGAGAAATVIAALRRLEESGACDVVLVGRGGGSIEDLWCFNDEALARAVAACRVPVISAVGHETDFTICDFVADLRAPTPSAAAELCVPDLRDVLLRLSRLEDGMQGALERRIAAARQRVGLCERRIAAASPQRRLGEQRRRVEELKNRLPLLLGQRLREKRQRLASGARLLESLSPLKILSRGYGVVYKGGGALRSVEDVRAGDRLVARLSDGEVAAVAQEITKYRVEESSHE